MQRALVVGGSGFVGRRLTALLGAAGIGTYTSRPVDGMVRFDATRERLRDRLAGLPADLSHVFVPFGAIDMEGCAREPERTRKVNVDAVQAVLADALDAGLKPVFVSTDYVFEGSRGDWRETDDPQPRMAYGGQKLEVERWLAARGGPSLTVRLSKVLSAEIAPHNMLGGWWRDLAQGRPIACAEDQVFSPAWVDDLATAMIGLARIDARGLFHVAGPETFSRLALLQALIDAAHRTGAPAASVITACRLWDFPFTEQRPLDTSLNTDKLREHLPDLAFRSMRSLCEGTVARGVDEALGSARSR